MLALRRPQQLDVAPTARTEARPVLLATLGVPFDPAASAFAIDAAVESGQSLVVANVVELPFLPCSFILGYDQVLEPSELTDALRAPALLARSLGVEVERLRVKSPHPVAALLELVSERSPGLLVFGPDLALMRARVYRRAAKAVRERSPCLVWLPD